VSYLNDPDLLSTAAKLDCDLLGILLVIQEHQQVLGVRPNSGRQGELRHWQTSSSIALYATVAGHDFAGRTPIVPE
jgi:hypothetical protein